MVGSRCLRPGVAVSVPADQLPTCLGRRAAADRLRCQVGTAARAAASPSSHAPAWPAIVDDPYGQRWRRPVSTIRRRRWSTRGLSRRLHQPRAWWASLVMTTGPVAPRPVPLNRARRHLRTCPSSRDPGLEARAGSHRVDSPVRPRICPGLHLHVDASESVPGVPTWSTALPLAQQRSRRQCRGRRRGKGFHLGW